MICQALKCQFRTEAIALLFLITPLFLHAQNNTDFKPLVADNVKVTSKVLGEDRSIYIYVPPVDATNLAKRYPVLYLLDGENHFSMIAELCRYLSRWDVNVIPEMIYNIYCLEFYFHNINKVIIYAAAIPIHNSRLSNCVSGNLAD